MMGKHYLADEKSFVEVIAGEYNGTKGPASTFSPMQVYNARLKKDAKTALNFPANYNTGLLLIEGKAIINGSPVDTDHFVLFKNEGEEIDIEATEDTIILVLSGEPINEPIAAYGPFLMNSWPEVEQAIEDANRGKFGILED
jgi:quercetin 2,3-dioxygenase